MRNFGYMTFFIKHVKSLGIGCMLVLSACSENEDRPAETDLRPVAPVEKDSMVVISPANKSGSLLIDSIVSDTALYVEIKDKAAVFTIPDTSLIKNIIEDKGDEEFYSESDRNFFVQEQASKVLGDKGIKVYFPKKRYIAFKGNGKTYLLDTQIDKKYPWLSIYFNPDTVPVFFDPAKITAESDKIDQVIKGN